MMTSHASCFLNKSLCSVLFRHINHIVTPITVNEFSIKLVTLLGLLLVSAKSISEPPIRLYKQYLIDTSKAYLQKIHPLEDCSDKYEKDMLCMQKHSLAGEESEIDFRFLDNKLVSIVLMRAATYSVDRKNGQIIGTISFIVPRITQSYLDKNPIVEDF